MAIETNKLGRYEIRSRLAVGATGEVYLAHDPVNGRNVAIKVLPPAFSIDENRLRRFELEVQVTGRLNHPNILAVYDVETLEYEPYIVYEFVEGATLRQQLRSGALPSRVAIDYASQIAQGLVAAWDKGILHRSLSPDNLLITHDKRVKILDFGVAQLTQSAEVAALIDIAARIVNTNSAPVIETVGYKSPEQVRDQRLDHRSDIFSLGVILFEMLTGRRPFEGDSAVETLDAVLKKDPLKLVVSGAHDPGLERVVMHCLEKNPERRFQSARDLIFSLEGLNIQSPSHRAIAPLPIPPAPPTPPAPPASPVVPTAPASPAVSTPPASPVPSPPASPIPSPAASPTVPSPPASPVASPPASLVEPKPPAPPAVATPPATPRPSAASTSPPPATPREAERSEGLNQSSRKTNRALWIGVSVLSLALLAIVYFALFKDRNKTADSGLVLLPSDQAPMTGIVGAFSISPDGKRIAFVGSSEGQNSVWVRALDSATPQKLAGTEGASNAANPFWSPDSQYLGYFAGGSLKKVNAAGGSSEVLCEAPGARGGSWNKDNLIIFGSSYQRALYRTTATGGGPDPISTLDPAHRETSHRWPSFLPDGKHFLFLARSGPYHGGELYVGSLDSTERKHLFSTSAGALYAAPGYILFMRNDSLMAQPFDSTKLELSGEAFAVVPKVTSNTGLARGAFSVSDNGVLAYCAGNADVNEPLWFDREGKQIGSANSPGLYFTMSFSPDESRLAINQVDTHTGASDILITDLAQRNPSKFTTNTASEANPLWSPDGHSIVFSSGRDGIGNLYQKNADGTGNEDLLLKSDEEKWADDWTLDGKYIIYQTFSKTRWDLWVLPMFGDRKPYSYLQTASDELQARFSPDGKWVAYTSDESGVPEIYVRTFPASGSKWRVSTNGGTQPSWRRDGRELYYMAADRGLMAVEVKPGSQFETGVPQKLFNTRVLTLTDFRNAYLATNDGKRFLVNSNLEHPEGSPINVVVNWTSLLQRR